MPDPKFMKPWHGVPREQINWNPTVVEDACIGCGTCVTGCSRLVYRFDYERKKSVVVDPLNCMVGCTTCANTCPTHAIRFPSLSTVFALEGKAEVRHAVEDDLIARHDLLATTSQIPHPDRIVEMRVEEIARPTPNTLILRLTPSVKGECFCEFAPGQYVEVSIPGSPYLSRAYSIANAPRDDGSIELQIHRIEGGRLSDWAFQRMKEGDRVQVRGPLGHFTMRSPIDRPLVFVAGGTGFAPIKSLIEQQLKLAPQRDMLLFWGVADMRDFYELDWVNSRNLQDANLRIVLAAERNAGSISAPSGISVVAGNVATAMRQSVWPVAGRDAYVAGPPGMIPFVVDVLHQAGITPEHIVIDSFGLQ
jgi:CDP-4-dehydro-6-deoxyglucose reductase